MNFATRAREKIRSNRKTIARTETFTDLKGRARRPDGDSVYLYSTDTETSWDARRPALVQLALLRRVFDNSTWFARAQYSFLKYKPYAMRLPGDREVVNNFLFWIFHDRIATIRELDPITGRYPHLDAREDHQLLLVRTWKFAAHVELPTMQNAAMRALFGTFDTSSEGVCMSPENMQICLLESLAGSVMRRALVHCMLWTSRLNYRLRVGDWRFRHNLRWEEAVDISIVPGMGRDLEDAKWAFARRRMTTGERWPRPRASDFLVHEAA